MFLVFAVLFSEPRRVQCDPFPSIVPCGHPRGKHRCSQRAPPGRTAPPSLIPNMEVMRRKLRRHCAHDELQKGSAGKAGTASNAATFHWNK